MTPPPSRALVTGASGFIGSWLCAELLERGWVVHGLVRRHPRPDSLFVALELPARAPLATVRDRTLDAIVEDATPDVVFNLAGQSQVAEALRDPAATVDANVGQTKRLLSALSAFPRKLSFVHASTEAVYGPGGDRAFVETDALRPLGPYAASKAESEAAVMELAESGGPAAVIARLGNVYGPGDPNRARLIPDLMRSFAAGRSPRLREGESKRGYLHVLDAVEALVALGTNAYEGRGRGECFNVAAERTHSNLEVAELVRDAFARRDISIEVANDATPTAQWASSQKIQDLLGWRPRRRLAEALLAMAAEEMNRDAPRSAV